MKTSISLYLAGSIKKGHERQDETYWTEADMDLIRHSFSGAKVSFLNPALRSDDLSDELSVFGRDMVQVFCSDAVFVDARDRRGLGVGAEMMWAKVHKIPVISWAPKETHYHKSKTTLLGVPVENFIHPFVKALSDFVAENLDEACLFLSRALTDLAFQAKGLDSIAAAMRYYKETQLSADLPMRQLMAGNEALSSRIVSALLTR